MSNIPHILKRTLIGLAAIVQLLFFPVITFAETPSSQPAEGATPSQASPTQGPASPNGADASTYTFNSRTGLWENEHYTWDPKTKQTKPKKAEPYTHNPTTGTWDTKEWKYDAPSKTYKPNVPTTGKPSSATGNPTALSGPAGANSPSSGTAQQTGNHNTTLNNNLTTTSQSGNASIKDNTSAGSATTGSAHAATNVLSMLQSSWGLQGSDIATFDSSIHGNTVGDLLLDPATIAANGLKLATASPSNLDINVRENSTINNTIVVGAKSGDAEVVSNTSAGDAKTGDATALANVINVISSAIHSGQSFVGNINIYGDLEGDILLPDSVKKQLGGASVPATTQLDTSNISNGELLEEFTDNQNISNDVHLSAKSGQANTSNNSQAGSATSGDSKTNLTLLNLTGKEVVGSNALLVFVNVLGKWTGMIVDAPAGATTGMLGNHNETQHIPSVNGDISATRNLAINNTITANAQSGDATVSQNTIAGNAATGNTRAGVNLLNITNSNFSLADWFGVLFINVFGTWNGSFGMDTPMGNLPANVPLPSSNTPISEVKVFAISDSAQNGRKIVPVSASKQRKVSTSPLILESTQIGTPQILGTTSSTHTGLPTQPKKTVEKDTSALAPAVAAILLGAALLLLERIISRRTKTSDRLRSIG